VSAAKTLGAALGIDQALLKLDFVDKRHRQTGGRDDRRPDCLTSTGERHECADVRRARISISVSRRSSRRWSRAALGWRW